MADKATIIKQTQKLIAKGQVDKAISMWISFIGQSKDANISNTIGDLYLKIRDKKNASVWFHKSAKALRDDGFFQKAIAIYRKALNLDPSDPDTLLALGELNEDKGLIPESIKFYLATIDALNKKGRKDEVLGLYHKILGVAPSNLPLRTKIAEYFIKEGLKQDASKEYIHIARLYEEKGESPKAEEYFNKALELYPQNKDAYLSMSKLFATMDKKDDAIRVLNMAIEAFPDDADLQVQVVDQLVGEEKFDEATELLKQLAQKEPDNIGIKEQIAHIHSLKGNKEKAWDIYSEIIDELHLVKKPAQLIEILKEFSEQDPVEIGKRLAYLYKETEDNQNALQEFIKVGGLLKDSGMYEEALNIFNEAKSLDPDNKETNNSIAELNSEMGMDEASTAVEKTTEEAITDAEIFMRYGQTEEAGKILESLKAKEPDNTEVHRKLKSLYVETGDKELAVTECFILSGLYEKEGNTEKKEQALNEAFDIDPSDPRLVDRAPAPVEKGSEPASTLTPTGLDEVGASTESFEEELSEADFYFRQGLNDEALKIYRKLIEALPNNEEIKEKIRMIESTAASVPLESASFEQETVEEDISIDETIATAPIDEDFSIEETIETPLEEEVLSMDTEESFQDLTIEDTEPVSAEEIPEPNLESDVLEIFEEFKKGIESELEDEDSETHYNLGIAYKEMGLVDDAIKEFQTANKDPKRSIQTSSMLGICYMEKGLYQLAIDSLQKVMSNITDKDESYWGTKYELADAYEKNGNIHEAIDLFTEVYSHDSKFRKVDERLSKLGGGVIREHKQAPTVKKKKKKDRISYI
jgi:tetratricopeptide (TPR) repeat protein